MARKIDGITYPDNVMDILRSAAIGPAFRAFVKSRSAAENTNFLDDSVKFKPKKHFAQYFSEKSKTPINISSDVRKRANKLARNILWTDKTGWYDVYTQARKEIIELVGQNFVSDFFNSDYFKAQHHETVLKKTKVPKKLMDSIGVRKPEDMTEVITMFRSQKGPAVKAAEKLRKKYKSRISAKDIIEALINAN